MDGGPEGGAPDVVALSEVGARLRRDRMVRNALWSLAAVVLLVTTVRNAFQEPALLWFSAGLVALGVAGWWLVRHLSTWTEDLPDGAAGQVAQYRCDGRAKRWPGNGPEPPTSATAYLAFDDETLRLGSGPVAAEPWMRAVRWTDVAEVVVSSTWSTHRLVEVHSAGGVLAVLVRPHLVDDLARRHAAAADPHP